MKRFAFFTMALFAAMGTVTLSSCGNDDTTAAPKDGGTIELGIGETRPMSQIHTSGTGGAAYVMFASSNEAVLTVDHATKTIHGVALGTATLSVTGSDNIVKAVYRIKVGDVHVSNIEIATIVKIEMLTTGTFDLGQYVTAAPLSADNLDLVYSITAGDDIVSIDSATGVITAGGEPGMFTVKIEAADGFGAEETIGGEVSPTQVSSIEVNVASFQMSVNKTYDMAEHVSVLPTTAYNKNLTYSISAGGEYATINAAGLITAGADLGSFTVKIESADGAATKTINGTVVEAPKNYVNLDRTVWTMTTSHATQVEGSTERNWQALIDGNTATFMGLPKPGRGVAGEGDAVWFIVDLGSTQSFNYFELTNRNDQWMPHLYIWSCDVEISTDGLAYTSAATAVEILPAAYQASSPPDWSNYLKFKYQFTSAQNARYVKFIATSWNTTDTSRGHYVQPSELQIGTVTVEE